MRIANHSFLTQLGEAAFDQRAQRLVVERCSPQKLCRAYRCVQPRDRFQKFRLARGTLSQFLEFIVVDLVPGLHE